MLHIANLNLKMKNHTIDCTDRIHMFDFLTRFGNEADMLNISTAQAFIHLPRLVKIPYKLKQSVTPRWHYLMAGGHSLSPSNV